jgi:hypothetical protein
MNEAPTIRCKFHVRRHGRRTKLREGEADVSRAVALTPVPRISRLMALAIRFDRLIHDGVVANFADLAALGRVTRARVTQIMNLLNLAPDIQEKILFLDKPVRRQEIITEKRLRPMAADANWSSQRRLWQRIHTTGKHGHASHFSK